MDEPDKNPIPEHMRIAIINSKMLESEFLNRLEPYDSNVKVFVIASLILRLILSDTNPKQAKTVFIQLINDFFEELREKENAESV